MSADSPAAFSPGTYSITGIFEGKIGHTPEMQPYGYKGKLTIFLGNFAVEEKFVLVLDSKPGPPPIHGSRFTNSANQETYRLQNESELIDNSQRV